MHGWGPYSIVSPILLAAVPDKVHTPSSTTNTGTNVVVTWTAPSSDEGSKIVAYRIMFLQSNGVYSPDVVDCDGTNATVISNLQCTVPMISFISPPYSLAEGILIVVTVEGLNAVGYSLPS